MTGILAGTGTFVVTATICGKPFSAECPARNAKEAEDLFWDEVFRVGLVGLVHDVSVEAKP